MLKSKKLLSTLLAIVICVISGTTTFAADLRSVDAETAEEARGCLNVVDQGIKIYAPVSDILTYVDAADETAKAQALQVLISDPNNSVSELISIPFARVPDTTDINEVGVVPARSPGTWTITGHVVPAGGVTRYGAPFDVAYNETVHLVYYFAGTRILSSECETSYPSTFWDPTSYTGGFQSWWANLPSGQYYLYVKNWSSYDMTVTSGYVQIS